MGQVGRLIILVRRVIMVKMVVDSSGILAIDVDVYEFRVFSNPKPHVKYLIRVSERLVIQIHLVMK